MTNWFATVNTPKIRTQGSLYPYLHQYLQYVFFFLPCQCNLVCYYCNFISWSQMSLIIFSARHYLLDICTFGHVATKWVSWRVRGGALKQKSQKAGEGCMKKARCSLDVWWALTVFPLVFHSCSGCFSSVSPSFTPGLRSLGNSLSLTPKFE